MRLAELSLYYCHAWYTVSLAQRSTRDGEQMVHNCRCLLIRRTWWEDICYLASYVYVFDKRKHRDGPLGIESLTGNMLCVIWAVQTAVQAKWNRFILLLKLKVTWISKMTTTRWLQQAVCDPAAVHMNNRGRICHMHSDWLKNTWTALVILCSPLDLPFRHKSRKINKVFQHRIGK